MPEPSLDPYFVKLERFELFSTNQCYYLVACDKHNTSYRVLKMDRTLIERPPERSSQQRSSRRQQQHTAGTTASVATSPSQHGAGSSSSDSRRSHRSSRMGTTTTPTTTTASTSSHHGEMIDASQNTTTTTTTNTTTNSDTSNHVDSQHHTPKPTLRPLSDFLFEDPNVYTQDEIKEMLDMIHDGNRMSSPLEMASAATSPRNNNNNNTMASGGGLKPIVKAYGIVGFVRFLDCYYLTLITKRSKVGSIGGNGVYTIKTTETVPLKPAEQQWSSTPGTNGAFADDVMNNTNNGDHPSSVLLSMWNRGKRSVGLGLTNREIAELRYQGLYQVIDLTKNFYFSYQYDLTRSLQENMMASTIKPFPPPPFKEMYAWNFFLTREFEACLDPQTSFHWIMPVIHGAFAQRKVIDYGKSLNLVLIARRSRHFAGTRYLKRGVSEEGKVANDVEHEQIVHDESISCASGVFSSYLQVRGSIPTYWSQESSVTMPKPPIEINRVDPTYTATQSHFEDLIKRYSSPILVLDLVKQSEKREREVRVGNEFRHAVDYINQTIDDEHKIRYCALDYSHISKHRNLDVTTSLNEVSTWAVNQTGFFCSLPKWKILPGGVVKPFTEEDGSVEQTGVLRTNCIDCLDRTNAAQYSAGLDAIAQQLVVMGIRSKAKFDLSSNIVRVLMDMYVDVGDSIALQYGGSEAHRKVTATKNESAINIPGPIGKHKELLTSIRRYYSNAFTDRLKQDAMNLFLGYYIPYNHTVPLWDMETDYYLHNFHAQSESMNSMKSYQQTFGIDWTSDEVACSPETEKLATVIENAPISSPRTNRQPSNGESQSIQKVRGRCSSQNEMLSCWWKTALQSHIKERMWTQVGQIELDTPVPSRFERLYQPEKLSQFDRFFTRNWATPVRRSHSAQQTDGPEIDPDNGGLVRYINEDSSVIERADERSNRRSHDGETLATYLDKFGYEPRSESSLKDFLDKTVANAYTPTDFACLGSLSSEQGICREYLNYVAPTDPLQKPYRADRIEEFKSCLLDTTLQSDDVAGIEQLAESAHIGKVILSGPYSGLTKDMSAVHVATSILEQFNAFQALKSGENDSLESESRSGGRHLAEMELERQGLGSEGVVKSVHEGWNAFTTAERHYTEIVEGTLDHCTRSNLTTAESLQLYSSALEPSSSLSAAEIMFLNGERVANETQPKPPQRLHVVREGSDSFVQKANRLGVPIIPHAEIAKRKIKPLFNFGRVREVPPGWEQINEDLFAHTTNKFMVCNGAGIDSWTGNQPITNIARHETTLLHT